jgi:hypothetical protein
MQAAWNNLSGFQKVLLVGLVIVIPLSIFVPEVREIVYLPLSLMTCG